MATSLFGLPSREDIEKGTAVENGELIRCLEEYLEITKGVESKGGDVEIGGVQE
jgi:hypothetical protein